MSASTNTDQGSRDAEARAAKVAAVAPADPLSPADRYRELFVAVQQTRVFDDSKTFVDCAPRRDPDEILAGYRACKDRPGFDLRAFVDKNFVAETPHESDYVCDPDQSLVAHIDGLWDVLTRQPAEHPARCSLLPLPEAYVVPGGRFGELYYWDSYFTMLGLAESGRHDLLRSMADNFAYLIDTCGHVPNGNRSYYLSRSQPPVFAMMVELFEQHGVGRAVGYLPQLRAEHAFWMDGADDLDEDAACRHCVRMPDGALLNRYWDTRDTPREEAWLEDVTIAGESVRPDAEVCRDLRAAAASGWDFSARWFDDDRFEGDRFEDGSAGLSSTRTTSIVPIDLNAFLHKLEDQIAILSRVVGDDAMAKAFGAHARARRGAIDRWLWNDAAGHYSDYDLLRDRPRDFVCAAAAVPLCVGVASAQQARGVAAVLGELLLAPGGIATSRCDSGQQWDRPNGWAPLHWMAIRGLGRYGHDVLSREITRRWLDTVGSLYQREGKLVEKYALRTGPGGAVGGGGGEYPLQDGFGWTNGVTRRLLDENPEHPCHRILSGRQSGRSA